MATTLPAYRTDTVLPHGDRRIARVSGAGAALESLCHALCAPWIVRETEKYAAGISALVRVKDEDEWVYPSLVSLAPLVDEIVIVDTSTDRSWELIQRFVREHQTRVAIRALHLAADGSVDFRDAWQYPLTTDVYAVQSTLALRLCTRRIVIRWDADFIGSERITELRQGLLDHARAHPGAWKMKIPVVNLSGDLRHAPRGWPLNVEPRVHTNWPALAYRGPRFSLWKGQSGRFEVLKWPPFFREYQRDDYYIYHMASLKQPRRLLLREFWTPWREDLTCHPERTPDNLEAYILRQAGTAWGLPGADLETLARHLVNRIYPERLAPYDEATYGPVPELAVRTVGEQYRMVRGADGRIIGRSDCLPSESKSSSFDA